MSEVVDARGLSCPQPVLDTLTKMTSMGSGRLEVIVDTDAARENVSRAAMGKGWQVESIAEDGDEYHIMLSGE